MWSKATLKTRFAVYWSAEDQAWHEAKQFAAVRNTRSSLRLCTPCVPEQIQYFSVLGVCLYWASYEARSTSARSTGCWWEAAREAPTLMSCGNTPRSKQFLKQLIKRGTEMPIESILGLSNEKVTIITGILLYQQYRVCVYVCSQKRSSNVFLKPAPVKIIVLLKLLVRNVSGAALSHCFLSQLT